MTDAPQPLYTVTEHEQPVALALTFPEGVRPSEFLTKTVAWTPGGHVALMSLAAALREGKGARLPTRSLAALLDLLVPGLERLRPDLALRPLKGERVTPAQLEFAWLDETSGNPADALQRWLQHEFKKLVKEDPRAKAELQQVWTMLMEGKLLELRQPERHLLPWGQSENATATPQNGAEFNFLLDWVARKLEGQTLFPNLPPVRRIVRRDSFRSKTAELMTDPVPTAGKAESFSLVLRVQVVTLPGVSQPLILMDVTKRRWVTRLKDYPPKGTCSGFAFPTDRSIAVRFDVKAYRGEFTVGDEFITLARELQLPHDLSVKQLAKGEATSEKGQVRVALRHGFGFHNVDAGVPERDKLDAFQQVKAILGPEGLVPWTDFQEVKYRRTRRAHRDLLNDDQLEKASDHPEDPGDEVDRTVQALKRIHPEEPTLILAHHPAVEADAKRAAEIIRSMTANHLNVELVRLPENVHGQRNALPFDDVKDASLRGQHRVTAWQDWLSELQQGLKGLQPTGVLVMAPKEYEGRTEDSVNKPAGRKAIASALKLPVQYLLPMEGADAEDFSYRVQFAWRDLTWAHVGRIDNVIDEVARHFPGTPPQEVLALSVIQRNDKSDGRLGAKIPVAFKLDLSTQVTYARMAHLVGRQVETTPWEPLPQLLVRLASMPAPEMGTGTNEQRTNFERFCRDIINEAADSGSAPLVLINSTHSASMWPWLRDTDINPETIDFATAGLGFQERWPDVRLVRIREGYTPQLLLDKYYECTPAQEGSGQKRTVSVPTSKSGALYSVEQAKLPLYFSIGKRDLHQHKRGLSCVHDVELLQDAGKTPDGHTLKQIITKKPSYKQWPTPNAVELTLAKLLPDDQPQLVARFVELLRSGYGHYAEASTLPAPLFFERVVKEYITEFVDDNEPSELDTDDLTAE